MSKKTAAAEESHIQVYVRSRFEWIFSSIFSLISFQSLRFSNYLSPILKHERIGAIIVQGTRDASTEFRFIIFSFLKYLNGGLPLSHSIFAQL